MNTPTAFRLLRIFSARELNLLADFLNSPAFNHRPEMIKLLLWWRENRHSPLDSEVIYKKILPNKKYLARDWYLMVSRFQSLIEQFMAWQEVKQQETDMYRYLLRNLRNRKNTFFFERSIKKAKAALDKQQDYTATKLYQIYELEESYYEFIASPKRQTLTNLQAVGDRLDEFFIAQKLKQACLAHSRKVINQESYDIYFITAIEEAVQERPLLLEVPAINIYYACYLAVVLGGEEPAFQALRQSMTKYQSGFSKQEVRDIYLLATNYCIKALNQGKENFAVEALALYEHSLDQGALLEDGYIPESTFTNVVSLSLRLNRFNWAQQFIHQQAALLRPAFQESLPLFSIARLDYEKGDLKGAMQKLARVETRIPFLYLGTKSLQLKIFYELDEWDALDSLLESMRVYLQRRKDLGYRKQHYLLLLQFTRRLIQLQPSDNIARKALITDLTSTKAFREREWFLKHLEG